MPDNQDYTELTLAGLRMEDKKLKRMEITSALMIGFLAGVMIYGVAMNGFGFIYTVIPVILIIAIVRNSFFAFIPNSRYIRESFGTNSRQRQAPLKKISQIRLIKFFC